ncbi:uncharacterized protein LOC130135749 [Syzygium oleosum]|uniref:uncharacterized protein LOC130135749 n=1 Tax=Syzygium oleosum TaxID=219896 RepID=UPI0024B8EC21|nr:uncharacterized protein LOC130135749 [Syzygium oleosum]
MDKGEKHVVDVLKRDCSCRRWQLTGIPCPHAISAINHRQEDAYDYIDEYYKKAKFLVAYENMIMPVQGEKFWKKTNREPPEPLPARVKPGRRKQKRSREEGEVASGSRMLRIGMKMTCRTCSETGHNSLTCPIKKIGSTSSQTRFSRQKLSAEKHPSNVSASSSGSGSTSVNCKSCSKRTRSETPKIPAQDESTSFARAVDVPAKEVGPLRKKKNVKNVDRKHL